MLTAVRVVSSRRNPLAAQVHPQPLPDEAPIVATTRTFNVVVAATESLRVTIKGRGDPVVLIPGLVGSSFGYRRLSSELSRAGFMAVVIEPLGIGGLPRPERANYSLTSQADWWFSSA
jgi:hypothetical protein